MEPIIHAIPTRYGGITFRSRLEARFAVYLDALDLNWIYEPEGLVADIDDGYGKRYLPDFLVYNYPKEGLDFCLNAYRQIISAEKSLLCEECLECMALFDTPIWVEVKPKCPSDLEVKLLQAVAKQTGYPGYFLAGQLQMMLYCKDKVSTLLSHPCKPSMDEEDPDESWHNIIQFLYAFELVNKETQVDIYNRWSLLEHIDYPARWDGLKRKAVQQALNAKFEFSQTSKRKKKRKTNSKS